MFCKTRCEPPFCAGSGGGRAALFAPLRPGYLALAVDKAAIQTSIHQHPEFVAYTQRMAAHFDAWRSRTSQRLKKLKPGFKPKALIVELAEDLLARDPDLWAVVVAPWVVIQEREAKPLLH